MSKTIQTHNQIDDLDHTDQTTHDDSTGTRHRHGTGALSARLGRVLRDDSGMSTVEYAIGTVAAAAFGALLYTVVTGGDITSALTGIVQRALNTQGRHRHCAHSCGMTRVRRLSRQPLGSRRWSLS